MYRTLDPRLKLSQVMRYEYVPYTPKSAKMFYFFYKIAVCKERESQCFVSNYNFLNLMCNIIRLGPMQFYKFSCRERTYRLATAVHYQNT